ncbi:hypothetical protein [Nocardioides antri]|uniref:Uncharacterized protein n=1 Tax=Nocardioides antri TaxID=2607659 RepID=A0A5B1M553_9ACTN|nr:hypothetical protein [Nocardioides antri]KAA1426887.1 hypothetical protein F0U47_11940 [Nocardioides antri]
MNTTDPDDGSAALAGAGAASAVAHPTVVARPVVDPGVLGQGRVFKEALNQTHPIACIDQEVRRVGIVVRNGTAQRHGLSRATSERMAAAERPLHAFASGANPRGLAAEVVAVADYRELHAGIDVGIVNAPTNVSRNLLDIRIAPDSSSRKDLVFAFDDHRYRRAIWKPNGQVKTGGSQYVADSLVKMANTPGYGKVGYVDARYVNADGTPRVAADAFTTAGQARRLQEARVRLRGFPDLEARADQLIANIRASKADELDPVARQELLQLRDDLASAYSPRRVAGRVGGSAATAAASAAVVSLVVQRMTGSEVDARSVAASAGVAAAVAGGGAVADAAVYYLAIRALGMTAEAAKELAQRSVAVGSVVIAVGGDVVAEVRAARRVEVSVADAVGGVAAKAALDLLPLVIAQLGLVGVPVVVGAQAGGRSLIVKAREADRMLAQRIATDEMLANDIAERMSTFRTEVEGVVSRCADTDGVFDQVMNTTKSPLAPLNAVGDVVGGATRRMA